MSNFKSKLHDIMFPQQAAMLALQADLIASQAAAAAEDARLIERMGEELDHEHAAKKSAWVSLGHYKTELQALRFLDGIQKKAILVLDKARGEAMAQAWKWKGAALELEEELKSSFFEIAELNKRLERAEGRAESGAQNGAHGAQVVPMLAYSA